LRALFILDTGVLEDDVPDVDPDDVIECIELLEQLPAETLLVTE
jgi:hypothetical protein